MQRGLRVNIFQGAIEKSQILEKLPFLKGTLFRILMVAIIFLPTVEDSIIQLFSNIHNVLSLF